PVHALRLLLDKIFTRHAECEGDLGHDFGDRDEIDNVRVTGELRRFDVTDDSRVYFSGEKRLEPVRVRARHDIVEFFRVDAVSLQDDPRDVIGNGADPGNCHGLPRQVSHRSGGFLACNKVIRSYRLRHDPETKLGSLGNAYHRGGSADVRAKIDIAG